VIKRLRVFLSNRAEPLDAFDGQSLRRGEQEHMIERAHRIAEKLHQTPNKIKASIAALVRRIEVAADNLKIELSQNRLVAPLASDTVKPDQNQPIDPADSNLTLPATVHLKRVGREMRLLVAGPNNNRDPDIGLLRIIAREVSITAGYIYVLLRLRWLAPDITTAIVNGQQPLDLNAKNLCG
jgi:hypothetical protein